MRTQPSPDVTAADVDRVVGRDFPLEQRSEVLAVLQQYGIEQWQRETDRVRLAALKLAAGSLARLRSEIEAAKLDYRDVLAAAEYPAYMKRAHRLQELSSDGRAQIIEDDWQQYQNWLTR